MWKELQCIVSRTEPELGLGCIKKINEKGLLEVHFAKAGETRCYSAQSAPLSRFRLKAGQKARLIGGEIIEITKIFEDDTSGLIQYSYLLGEIWEYDLEDRVQDHGALEHFFSGHFSRHTAYDLRLDARKIRAHSESFGTRGLVGPRVTPLPHQMFIASEVARRAFPRVLLADEVGLGKTIEAGLIFSSMRSLGRADRAVIIAPESLVHQWMAEMYRRFNQVFSVVDEERCENDRGSQKMSAFEANQYVVVSMEFLINYPRYRDELLGVHWDLAVIDEAHHLRWDEDAPDDKWLIAQKLAKKAKGLLLLTATPQQFGLPSQFGLLNLVDPVRFGDFEQFVLDHEKHRKVADLSGQLLLAQADQALNKNLEIDQKLVKEIRSIFSEDRLLLDLLNKPNVRAAEVLSNLIDRHGTGRVLFRNRRERLKGFPKRILEARPLVANEFVKARLKKIVDCDEMMVMDLATGRWNKRIEPLPLAQNPKFNWLIDHLQKNPTSKNLVLCGSIEGVLALGQGLEKAGIKASLFHEKLNVVERDKEAAMFADSDEVKLLICSEIGGEGRNFQHAQNLIFMDLPKHPDLVEQRIGRLDRIGQKKDIHIYVPYIEDTPEETLFRWYHEGLDSFCSSWNGASVILNEFIDEIFASLYAFLPGIAGNADYKKRNKLLTKLIADSKEFAMEVRTENSRSVDVLVDLNSYNEEIGKSLQEKIEDSDDDTSVEFFMRSFFDYYAVEYEEFDDRGSIVLRPDSLMFLDQLPGIQTKEHSVLTFDRSVALVREEMLFLTSDHPIVEESLALLIDRNEGVASICAWHNSPYGKSLLVDFSFILQVEGPKALELAKYLPTKIYQFTLNHKGHSLQDSAHRKDPSVLVDMSESEVKSNLDKLPALIEPLLDKCEAQVLKWVEEKINRAVAKAKEELFSELARIKDLAEINPLVSSSEINYYEERLQLTPDYIARAMPKLDSIRVIFTY